MQICVHQNIDLICGLVLIFLCGLLDLYQSPTIRIIHNCFRQRSAHLRLSKIFFIFKAAVLLQFGAVKISSGPKFDYSWQLHSHTFKGLGIRDHIETSPYIQDILTFG